MQLDWRHKEEADVQGKVDFDDLCPVLICQAAAFGSDETFKKNV